MAAKTLRILDPMYHHGVGFQPSPGHEDLVHKAVMHLNEAGLVADRLPWVVGEFIAETDDVDDALITTTNMLALHMGGAQLTVPSAADPDIQTDDRFPHHFAIGQTADTPLLAGAVTDAFRLAWQAEGICLFESHMWVRDSSKDQTRSGFVWTVLYAGPAAAVSVVSRNSKPLLVPTNSDTNKQCLYAREADGGIRW